MLVQHTRSGAINVFKLIPKGLLIANKQLARRRRSATTLASSEVPTAPV